MRHIAGLGDRAPHRLVAMLEECIEIVDERLHLVRIPAVDAGRVRDPPPRRQREPCQRSERIDLRFRYRQLSSLCAAVRRGAETTVALAGVAPVPWLLEGSLDEATPLPGTAYKVQVATALVERARAAVA